MSNDFTEEILSPDDEAKVLEFKRKLEDEPEIPTYHVLLKVWRDVLEPAAKEAEKPVTPQWANKMVATYAGLKFADCLALRDNYFGILGELAAILNWQISTDPGCLSYADRESDVENNAHHYKNIILNWQMMFLQYELEWDCTSEYAAVDLAALSEVHKTLFGGPDRQGFMGHLDAIGFTDHFTEADQQDLHDALTEMRENSERA